MKRKRYSHSSGRLSGFLRTQGIAVVLFIIVAAAVFAGVGNVSHKSSDEELKIAQDSIRRAVISYYAIEGRYPETYEYLKEKYGLTVDEDKYIIHYEIFASNIMPQITVIPVQDGRQIS